MKVLEVDSKNIDEIVLLLCRMANENSEFSFDSGVVKQSIKASFIDENVKWFLFYQESSKPLGVCYLQSVHNYWRNEKRFYLGGFYISPNYRGRGYFREAINQLKEWASKNDGVQIYTHIHKDNEKSFGAFEKLDFEPVDYELRVLHWGDD